MDHLLNRDEILDIVTGGFSTKTSTIILRYLHGRSAQFIIYTGNCMDSIGFVLTIDLNSDGYVDIIVTRHTQYGIGIYYGAGNQSFHDPILIYTNGTTPNNIVVADLNNDHRLYMVYTDPDGNRLVILLADDIGNYTNVQTIGTAFWPDLSVAALADFNLDNYLDLVVINTYEHTIAIYPNYGNGTFSTEYYSYPSALALGDLNNDEQIDVIVCNSETMNVGVFIIDHLADFNNQTSYALDSAPQPYAVKMGDLSGNNETDLVIVHAGTNNLIIFLDYHNGTFLDRVTYSTDTQSHPQYVIVIDLNRDHVLISVMGIFDGIIEYPTGAAPSAIGVGDFDNDNRTDLAVVNRDSDTIDLFFNYDYVMFSQQHSLLIGAGQNPKVVIIGDFNDDDDHLDIAVLELAPGLVDVFLNNDNGTFRSTISTETVASCFPVDMATEDFNHDHHLDVVVTIPLENQILIFLGDGNGSFTDNVTYSIPNRSRPFGVVEYLALTRTRILILLMKKVVSSVKADLFWRSFFSG